MDDSVSILQDSVTAQETLSCIIIDDEPIARRGLALLAARHPVLSLKAMFSGPEEALTWLESNSIDLVFLDIEMPGMKGTDFAKRLPANTMVVFTTAYSEYAAGSYDLDAVDYLLKPFDTARFDRAVRKAMSRRAALRPYQFASSPTITLRADRKFVNIDSADIIFIEGVKDYVRIHTISERIISRITIKSLLGLLPAGQFIRIHKSYVVNILYIKAYDNSRVILQPDNNVSKKIVLPVGAAFRSELEKLHSYQ